MVLEHSPTGQARQMRGAPASSSPSTVGQGAGNLKEERLDLAKRRVMGRTGGCEARQGAVQRWPSWEGILARVVRPGNWGIPSSPNCGDVSLFPAPGLEVRKPGCAWAPSAYVGCALSCCCVKLCCISAMSMFFCCWKSDACGLAWLRSQT